jgi:hypothetical protein
MNSYSFFFVLRYELLEASSRAASSRTSFVARGRERDGERQTARRAERHLRQNLAMVSIRAREITSSSNHRRWKSSRETSHRRERRRWTAAPRLARRVVLLPREPALVK